MKQTVRDLEVRGKRVMIRVDWNVPLDEATGQITDETRIRESLPTLRHILDQNASAIVMSHLGRPKGRRVPSQSLKPVAARLEQLLKRPVVFLPDCIGPEVEARVKALKPGEIIVLENLRFYAEEEQNDPAFASRLAKLADVYVNDAFGSAHRAHASTEGVAHHLPAVAGLLMEKEITYLEKALRDPARPFVAILGGAKVSDKIGVLSRLLEKVDRMLIGGGMAYTFLKAQGHAIGASKLEAQKLEVAAQLIDQAARRKVTLLLPSDHVVTTSLDAASPVKQTQGVEIPDGWLGADIGPKSSQAFAHALTDAKTVVWNGPVGVFEQARFCDGSRRIAAVLAGLQGTTIIGGGDTVACVTQCGFAERMSHLSTGGGASLEFLEGKSLPGISVLNDAPHLQNGAARRQGGSDG